MRERIYIIALLVAIGTFHAATVRQGHVWGDDFAMYVRHAQNIVEGRPYADTGYIYNPAFASYGPRSYPPVFPLLLVPLYKFFGLNFIPMKLEQVAFLLLTLVAIYTYWKRDLGCSFALALVAVLGFAPEFWIAKDNVLSDILFLFFFYLTAILVRSPSRDSATWARWAVAIGVVMYLATGTRTVGIALVAGLVLYDLLRPGARVRSTVVSILVYGACLALQRQLIGGGQGSYLDQLHPTLHTITGNLVGYARVLAAFWVASARNPFAYLVLAMFLALACFGFYLQWKERDFTFVEAALVPYLAIVILWPFAAGLRVVFVVVPWIGYLALSGLKSLSQKFVPRVSGQAAWLMLFLVAVPFAGAYRKTDFGPIRKTTGLPEFNQLCQEVRERTTPQDVVLYFRARALALYTGRATSVYNMDGRDDELWQWVRQIHASYFVTSRTSSDDDGFLGRFVQNNMANLDLVYENADFKLYRIRSLPELPERQR